MKIVIADDSALLREGVAGLVEKRGHEVIAMVDTAHGLVADIDDRFDDSGEPVSYTHLTLPTILLV